MKLIIEVPLWCPKCGARHVDEERNGEKWHRRAHTTHRCQSCGYDWDVYVSGAPVEVPLKTQTIERTKPNIAHEAIVGLNSKELALLKVLLHTKSFTAETGQALLALGHDGLGVLKAKLQACG